MKENKKKIIIWGAKGHAKVLRECIRHFGFELIAVFDNNPEVKSPFDDVPIFYRNEGFFKWLSTEKSENSHIYSLAAIGGSHGRDRHQIINFLEESGIRPLTVIHPSAYCASDARVGKGSQILMRATLGVDVKIGDACIINTGAIVDHDVVIRDGVHICPGSRIAGEVDIGSYSMIGTGAVILPGIRIGENAVVGAGSVVTKDVGDNIVVCGNPAKVLTRNTLVK